MTSGVLRLPEGDRRARHRDFGRGPGAPEGQYYWFELIGMAVETESGEKLGTMVDVFPTGSNDVYVMRSGRREIYLPATKEVIRQVDRKAGRMVFRVLDGLLD